MDDRQKFCKELYSAIDQRDIDTINKLYEDPKNSEYACSNEFLTHAEQNGPILYAIHYFKKNYDPFENNDGTTPPGTIVTKLVELTPHFIDKTDNDGNTLLHLVISNCHYLSFQQNIAKTLYKYNSKAVHVRNNDGLTPLHMAINLGSIDMFKLFLELYGSGIFDNQEFYQLRPQTNTYEVYSLMNYTASRPHYHDHTIILETLKLLIKYRYNELNIPNTYQQFTPLHHLANQHSLFLGSVRLLVKHGADLDEMDKSCNRPLEIAIAHSNERCESLSFRSYLDDSQWIQVYRVDMFMALTIGIGESPNCHVPNKCTEDTVWNIRFITYFQQSLVTQLLFYIL